MSNDISRVLRIGLLVAATLPLAACGGEGSPNRGMQSVHQPVVSHSTFLYDVQTDGSGVSGAEQARFSGWLDSLEVGYGDWVAVSTTASPVPAAARADIADVLARRGMLIEEDASAIAGNAPGGAVRVVLRRASASVPGCPDWSRNQETYDSAATSSNFGCGVNGNLAAMVANPDDLVRGQSTRSDLRTATSNRAIKTYQDKDPTGKGDLKTMSGGGN